MKRWHIILIAAIVAVIVVAFVGLVFLPLFFGLKSGYTKTEGFLELCAYPKISQTVPTLMVFVLVPRYDHCEIYLTEDGLPLSSVEGFSENDLVNVEGVLYSRGAVDRSETYWMIEIFNVSSGD
jgi:hypothetical protein